MASSDHWHWQEDVYVRRIGWNGDWERLSASEIPPASAAQFCGNFITAINTVSKKNRSKLPLIPSITEMTI